VVERLIAECLVLEMRKLIVSIVGCWMIEL
jgi:hypothetical protein